MKIGRTSIALGFFGDEQGQALPLACSILLGLLSVAGITIDVGHALVIRARLQNATNAAALAAAGEVYNNGSTQNAGTYAIEYGSGAPADRNYYPDLGTVTTTPTPICLNMLLSSGSCGASSPNNAIKVTQTTKVPTYFMRIFGMNSLTVAATAIASMQGAAEPWNVAIVLDATPSMNQTDPYCPQSGSTAEQCAMNGIQTMLKAVNPCTGGVTSCAAANNAKALFRVSLFSFPDIATSQVSEDYKCTGTPTADAYALPAIPASNSTASYAPFAYTGATPYTSTYQITPPNVGNADANGFLSDYFKSSSTLNSSSILVKAVGYGSTKGCLKPPTTSGSGGVTYFAAAVYAAQTALQAEQAAVARLGIQSRNAIVFISDGQANALYNRFPQQTSTAGKGGISVTYAGSSSKNLTGTGNSFGIYPDYNDDCQQAIAASQYAIKAGTRFYSVAYGSESSGCVSDSNLVVTGNLNVPIGSASQVIPCLVMEDMASPGESAADPWYFYTEGSSIANGCKDTTHTSSNLSSIFSAIAATFTKPQLLPNTAK